MLTVVPKFLATNRCCIYASFPVHFPVPFPVPFPPDDEAAAPDDEAAAPDDGAAAPAAAAPCCAAHSLAYRAAASSDVFDEVVKFDGKLAPGFFYVETSNFFPFRGNGFYDADLVDYGIESGIITKDNITVRMHRSAR